MTYEEKKFELAELTGISKETIEEHLKLYSGYVKNTNLILDKVTGLINNPDTQYAGIEMQRRFGFEFDGMRNHEIYFALLEGGIKKLNDKSALGQAIEKQYGSFDSWLTIFKKIATTRGPGWVVLYLDNTSGQLLNTWVDEQHIGVLNGAKPILILDMWEHAYFLDYHPAEKMKYVDAFFSNVNWTVAESLFSNTK